MSKKRRAAKGHAVRGGIGFGSALAIVISWSLHQSILWAIIHGVFSWFYVIYYAFGGQNTIHADVWTPTPIVRKWPSARSEGASLSKTD